MVLLVPRRRRFLPRPIDHLTRAAESHAALSGHTDNATAAGGTETETGLSSNLNRRRRTQRRREDGKFA